MNLHAMSNHQRFNFADSDALLQKIGELGVDIPFSEDVSALLEPIKIAGRVVPNRISTQPMEGCDGNPDGSPGELTHRRYRRFASGGSGLIWFEATAVVPDGRANPAQLCINDSNAGEFRRLIEQARAAAHDRFGSSHELLLVLQLTHSGRYSRPEGTPRPIIAHHSAVLDPLAGLDAHHPLITDAELDRLQDDYVHAAELAAQAGFDGVDVKACHGYLVSELLASFTRENSRYGGSFENRTRFLREIATRIRNEVPGVFVTSRISGYDGIPHPYGFGSDAGDPPQPSLSEPVQLVRELYSVGCPVLNVSAGNPYYKPHYGRPFDKPTIGGSVPDEHPLIGIARLIHITATLQQATPDMPVVGTGYSWLRRFFPHVGAAIINAGKAGFIGLGRLAFAYPDAAADLVEHGSLNPKKVCVTCSSCSQIMRDRGHSGCIVRDQDVYVPEYRKGRGRNRSRR